MGQHEAFLGNLEKSISYFQKAISCFTGLSEAKDLDIDQTRAYYATVQMDLDADGAETQRVMEKYLGKPVVTAAIELASSEQPADKYHHHILLRYLAQSQNMPAANAYLGKATSWSLGEGHPWEMIEFYRALLIDDEFERMQHLEIAYDIACQGGPTLQVIAAVILGAVIYYAPGDAAKREEFVATVEKVAESLPALGEERIATLRRQPTAFLPPLELARIVLPFNFR